MRRRLSIILVLVCSSLAGAVNDFSDAVSWWNFESDYTDELAAGNDLTTYGSPSTSNAAAKVGTYSLYVLDSGGTDAVYRTDTNLSSGFPGKNGTANEEITVCWWFRPTVLPTSGGVHGLLGKYYWGSGYKGWYAWLYNSSGNYLWKMQKGNAAGTTDQTDDVTGDNPTLDPANNLATSRWYHCGMSVAANGDWRIRVWDETNAVVEQTTGNYSDNDGIPLLTVPWYIGARSNATGSSFDVGSTGYYDEVVVWNRVLSQSEIDAVRGGTYSPPGSGGTRRRIIVAQ